MRRPAVRSRMDTAGKSRRCILFIAMLLAVLPTVHAVTEIDDLLLDSNDTLSLDPKRLPAGETARRRLRCIGWRATASCTPDGPREPQNDKSCIDTITAGSAGFCEVEDLDSGERFQVMRSHCSGLQRNVSFRCSGGPYFADFRADAHSVVEKAYSKGFALPNVVNNSQLSSRDGIAMVVYPTVLASAYASIRVIRDVLGCRLPIEIWFHVDEMGEDFALLAPLQRLAMFVGGVSLHPVYNPQAKGLLSKIFAIYLSNFNRVLVLDADNVPVRDPTFLFTSLEFETTGAVFWPDFWHPRRTIFNVHAQSMLWELLDTPFVDMFEQEGGQLMVDRTRHAAPLELVYFYAFHEPNYFRKLELVYGDKDLFRLAWLKLQAPFHMIEAVPAMAGLVKNGSFCGMTMAQHDADGEVLFLHRNQHRLTGERDERWEEAAAAESTPENVEIPSPESLMAPQSAEYPDPAIWTHLMSFRKNTSTSLYEVDAYRAEPEFPQWQPCYGKRYVDDLQYFEIQEVADLSISGIESDLRHYAMEARRH